MTTLDVEATRLRLAATAVKLPKFSTVLVTLIGLLPFLLAWTTRAVREFLGLLVVSWVHGWQTAGRQLGPKPPDRSGGS